MNITSFFNLLKEKNINCLLNEPMHKHTTFKTGGCADVFVIPSNNDELKFIFDAAKKYDVQTFVLGKGSNILVSDDGIEGAVISLSAINNIEVEDNCIKCGAGASLAAVCVAAREASLTGLEFAYGIPGSAGGALYMNAGAYGGEISSAIKSAKVIDANGDIFVLNKDQMELGYRTSIFSKKGYIITEIILELNKGNKEDISAAMDDYMSRRKEKQPLNFPSAGSTFKRPVGHFAGALIEKNQLKGYTVGGAQVSELHAGFVINANKATTADILKLIKHIQKVVFENDGIMLETEVIYVGRPFKEL
ncbi:MAG: UDP-N-acetylmuramate dehydrogenase [Clostridia bacterium]|nr:UDP-N-acetylmuramate dehydrogenase [Clostridia bacterium]